jgi:hypothetical protein
MDPSHLVAETGADPSMAIIKLKTRRFGSGSPASALVLSLIIHAHSRRSDISRSIGTLDGASCSTEASLDREGMADLQLVVTIGKFKVGVYAG